MQKSVAVNIKFYPLPQTFDSCGLYFDKIHNGFFAYFLFGFREQMRGFKTIAKQLKNPHLQ